MKKITFYFIAMFCLLFGANEIALSQILTESFETSVPPTGWSKTVVVTTATNPDWTKVNAGVYPTCSPQSGSFMTMFNSYNCQNGAESRLATNALNFTGKSNIRLSFWMYHDIGLSNSNDYVQIQASTDGVNWTSVGNSAIRYSNLGDWKIHIIDLSAYDGQPNVYIGFLGHSYFGNNIFIDNINIYEVCISKPTGTLVRCSGAGTDTYTTSANGTTTFQWAISPVAAGTISGTGSTGTITWSASFSGTATITAKAMNGTCSSISEPLYVTVGATTSAFNLFTPANGSFTSNTPHFYYNTSSGASSYVLYIDGAIKKTGITGTDYQIQNSEALSSGMHTWYIKADGCTQSDQTWSFRVDATPPTVFDLVSPANNSWTTNLLPTFQWSASADNLSGLAKYQLWIDGTLDVDNISTTLTSITPYNNLSNGSHTWQIVAVDNVGNTRNSNQTFTIKIDNMPPGNGLPTCLYFNGTSNYVSIPHNSTLNFTGSITIEAWIKITEYKSWAAIVSKGDYNYSDYGYALTQDNSGHIRFYGNNAAISSYSIIPLNTWTHVAITYSNSYLYFYINGMLDKSNYQTINIVNNTTPLKIGIDPPEIAEYWKGNIDEVRIWNTVRTQSQVVSDMNTITSRTESNLMGYWRFNEGSGYTTIDNSNNHNNGTINGATYQNSPLTASSALCSLKSPSDNQFIITTTPNFIWTSVTDGGIGLKKYQLWLDGALAKDNLSDTTCTLITPLAYGQHSWYVKGSDSLDNNQSSYQSTFFIDNQPPNTFNLTSPTDNQIVNLPTPNLSWEAATDYTGGCGIRKYQLWINGVKDKDSVATNGTNPSNVLAQGAYTWFVKVFDNLGNVRQSNQTWTFYVDWDPPTDFTLISPSNSQTVNNSRPTFTWHKSSDIGSGLVRYELTISGQTPINILATDSTYTLAFDLSNGNYTWFVKAYDRAGSFTSSNINTFTVAKLNQTITFDALPVKLVNDPPFTLTASTTSGLPITYTSSNLSVATVSGSTVTIVGVGSTNITASQAGNNIYNAATSVTQALTINKSTQVITFNPLPTKTYGDATFNLTATGGNSGNPVAYTSSNTSIATISGTTVTIIGAGTTDITASQNGNNNYYAATPVTQTLTVNKANQLITFGTVPVKTYGNSSFSLSSTSNSGLIVTYSSSNTSVASISGNIVTIVGAGSADIIASQNGNVNYNPATPVTQPLTVNKANQTITFNSLPIKTYGNAPFNLTAATTSGLLISYVSSNTNVATISGNTVTIVGGGTTDITASQSGNNNYNPATPVMQTLTVNPANQTITFNSLPTKTYGDAPFNLTASASSGLPISYISWNTNVATISGNTVTIVGAGTADIMAEQNGNNNYNSAITVTWTLTVNKANQVISFTSLPAKIYGDAPFDLTASGGNSGNPVTFVSSNLNVATISGNTVTIIGAGATQITASQGGNNNYNSATSVIQTLTVSKAAQTITFNSLPAKTFNDMPFSLNASSNSGLTVTYNSSNTGVATISGNIVTIVSAGTTDITAYQAGNNNYNPASSVMQTLTVNKANQTITFDALPSKTYGDAPFNLNGSSTSGLTITYSSSNLNVATILGNIVTIVGTGTTEITAIQSGNNNYNPASPVTQSLSVIKSDQTITFAALLPKNYDDIPFSLSATTNSGLTIAYNSSNTDVATISGNIVTIVGVGTVEITASQAGNNNYNPATPIIQPLTVNKANQIINFNALPTKTFGDVSFDIIASGGNSGNPITFVSSNLNVATISGNTVTIVGAGTTVITASQTGNNNYNPATPVIQILTVNKANQVITFNILPTKTFGDIPFDLVASGGNSGNQIIFVSSNLNVATISGITVTIVGAGTTEITASQASSNNYNAANAVMQTLTVSKANQVITFNTLPTKTFGDIPFDLVASGGNSGNSITFISSNLNVATISGNTVTIVGAGTSVITSSQTGNTNYNAANAVMQTLKVNKANQVITFNTLPGKTFGDVPFDLTTNGVNSGNPITFVSSNLNVATISGNTVTIVGAGTTEITASQSGNSNYNSANQVMQTLTVNKANQIITFNALPSKTFGDIPYVLTGSINSGFVITYTSSNTNVATISGNTVTIVGAGTTEITASQSGNSNYNSANQVMQTLTVNKANQVITFNALPNKIYGDVPYVLTGSINTGLAITFTSSNTNVATISSNTVTIVGTGTTDITASQAGNGNYNPATSVMQTLSISKTLLTVTADNKTRNFGQTNPTFTLSFAGFVYGETQSVLDVLPTTTCGASASSNAGVYDILVANGSDNNYNFAYQKGTLTVFAILPVLTTSQITSITNTTAQSGGDITSNGGADISVRGICWNTSGSPSITDSHTSDGIGVGTFTSNLINLIHNTKYYVRAYATSTAGINYGNEINFTTTNVGISQIDNTIISIYPNPTTEKLFISYDKPISKNSELIFRNIAGQTISILKLTNQTNELNVSNLPKGLYFIELKLNNQKIIRKIVIE